MASRAESSLTSVPGGRAGRSGAPNVLPVSRELLADLETPISAYLRLRDLPSSFLLESVEGPEQVARFSVLGGNPRLVLECDGLEVRVLRPDGTVIERGRPLETVARYLGRYRAARDPELPPFTGGFLGYLADHAVRLWSGCRIARPTISSCPSSAWPSWTPSSRSTIGATPCESSPAPSSTRMAGPRPRPRAPTSGSIRSSSGSGRRAPPSRRRCPPALAPVELDAGGRPRRGRARPGTHPSR